MTEDFQQLTSFKNGKKEDEKFEVEKVGLCQDTELRKVQVLIL